MVTFTPLRWDRYATCRALFEEVFDMSELSCFRHIWSKRCETRSIGVLYKDVLVAFVLVDKQRMIHYICVHPEFQNDGLGTSLLRHVLSQSSEDRSLWLTTAADDRLVPWYGRHGFTVSNMIYTDGEFIGANMVKRQRCRSALPSTHLKN